MVRGIYDRRLGLIVWTIGVSAVAALFVVLTKTMVQPLLAIPGLAAYFAAFVHGGVYSSFLAFIWFGFAQLLLAGFAITQVGRWSAEDADGRLEMILSNPVSRTWVLLERAAVLAVGASVIAAASGIAVGVEAHYQSISVDTRSLAEASALLVPFTLVFGAVGGLLAARVPRGTVGILGVYVFVSYLDAAVRPDLQLSGLGAEPVRVQAVRPAAHRWSGPHRAGDHARDRGRRVRRFGGGDAPQGRGGLNLGAYEK